MNKTLEISVKGRKKIAPACKIENVMVIEQGRFIKTAEIFDEYWLEREKLPSPEKVINVLREKKDKPDIYTFAQRLPDVRPLYNYHLEWDNIAALTISSYKNWFEKQISSSTRRNIRASKKRGVITKAVEFDRNYIEGIMSIFNEAPFRHGKKYWHYGKNFETVKKETGTYKSRSTFLAAYFQDQMIGWLKIVWDKDIGAIMQILSKMEFFNRRPNNALLSEAVRQCEDRKAKYLLYEKFDYGKKVGDSLTKFKQVNGFMRMDVPRYYIPITKKGLLALRLGAHHDLKERFPEALISPLRELRGKWYQYKSGIVGK